MMKLPRKLFIHSTILTFLCLIIWLLVRFKQHTVILDNTLLSKFVQSSSSSSSSSESTLTIARVLYLFLCEDQNEINEYIKGFPSITADVMFLCWRSDCVDDNFSKLTTLYVIRWSGQVKNYQPFVQPDPTFDYTIVKPRVSIINERQLNLTHKTTWTTGRNMLYERALIEEKRQGWRWAYYIFGDGDIQVTCSLAEKLLKTNQITADELVLAQQFRALINIHQSRNINISTDQCFILMDTFLLTVSPAIGSINGMGIPTLVDGLLTQIVYHVDAMFNAIHRDALPFVLPYCARYDARSWWTSQAIFVYRSLCLYGHAIQFNAVSITRQKHRNYPRVGSPWAMDADMNLVPRSLIPLQIYMKQERIVSALVLQHYGGWSLETTSTECRNGHTTVDPLTCKVGGKQNKTNS